MSYFYILLLHSVVYNTVVCINTIIYFSMKIGVDKIKVEMQLVLLH